MSYTAKQIANFFIDLASQRGESLTQMKLQKLVYFAHGWCLGLDGGPLLDEVVQAWSFGPVVRSLYNEFREFGSDSIDRPAHETTWDASGDFTVETPSISDAGTESEGVAKFLDRIWEVYGKFTAGQLSNMTHAPGTPWDQVHKRYGGKIPKNATIPDESIQEYFRSKAAAP